jgi:chromosome segregation ATPase
VPSGWADWGSIDAPDIALTERNRQNEWPRHRAASLVTKRPASATTAIAAVEQAAPSLRRETATLQSVKAAFNFAAGKTKFELANELEEARQDVTRLERRLSQETEAAATLRERVRVLTAEGEAADTRAAGLEIELGATRDRLRGERDVAAENARVSKSLIEMDAALEDARARIKFLETALAAAEAECTRMAAEARAATAAREKRESESETLNGLLDAMSARALMAEKMLADARQRLLARSTQSDAAEQGIAEAKATCREVYSENQQLRESLRFQQKQVEELEQSRLTLVVAANALLETFQNRKRGLIDAEQKIKCLTERNAQLEAEANSAASRAAVDRRTMQQRTADSADERMRKNWAELARQLAIRSKSNVTLRGPRECIP